MKKIMFFLAVALLTCSVSFAETGNEGRFIVKNEKVPTVWVNENGSVGQTAVLEELLKIDTTTGQVWQWNSYASKGGRKNWWQELKNEIVNTDSAVNRPNVQS